jgi:hypothetical protein
MTTTRKTTKKSSNQVYNHPVYRDGVYEIITDVNIPYFYHQPLVNESGFVSLITYRGKVVNIAGLTQEGVPWVAFLEYVKYDKKYGASSEPATGRFSPKTVIKLLNTPPDYFPHMKIYPSPHVYDALPASVMMKLGFRRSMWSRKR